MIELLKRSSMQMFGKFFLLGVVSLIVDYTIYSLMLLNGINYASSIIVGYSGGFIVNFYGGRKHIFTLGAKTKHFTTELLAVFLIALTGLGINIVIVKILSYSLFTISPYFSRVIAIGTVFFWNYAARKKFIYY
jgi:putative flippase GtrA